MNVFDFARELESSGQRFYGDMAARAGEKGVRNIFSMLAEDEAGMLAALEKLEARYGSESRDSRTLERGDNIFAELQEREDELQVNSDIEAYRLARMAERQIVDRYRSAIRAESDPEVKALLQRIAAIKERELDEIEHLCDFVEAPNHFLEWGEFSNLDEFHNFGRYEN